MKKLIFLIFCVLLLCPSILYAQGIDADTTLLVHCNEADGTSGTDILDSSFTDTKTQFFCFPASKIIWPLSLYLIEILHFWCGLKNHTFRKNFSG